MCNAIPDDERRLVALDAELVATDLSRVIDALKTDHVVLIRNVSSGDADDVILKIADRLDLAESLELQAGLASFHGHRSNVGEYFMTVNPRTDYQFIPAHSEGSSFQNYQLASFYCTQNTTDGGATILLNARQDSSMWDTLREFVQRAKLGSRVLSRGEITLAKGLYNVRLPDDLLGDGDQIVDEIESTIAGLKVMRVWAKLKKTYSSILERDLYAYWDTISSYDHDSATEYVNLLKGCALLIEPPSGIGLTQLDNAYVRRISHLGVKYGELFSCKIIRKLEPGELIVYNNMTWAHSASNWTPTSGVRSVAAAFA